MHAKDRASSPHDGLLKENLTPCPHGMSGFTIEPAPSSVQRLKTPMSVSIKKNGVHDTRNAVVLTHQCVDKIKSKKDRFLVTNEFSRQQTKRQAKVKAKVKVK
jgi:hypothetical protein